MRRRLILTIAVGLFVSACALPLGRSAPECDSVKTSVVLQVQSVPGSSYVSCIKGLKTGWSYEHLEARSGHSQYWLDSDRLGEAFITVETVLSCAAEVGPGPSVEDLPIQFIKDVVSETTVNIVIVPEGVTGITRNYAAEVRADLEGIEMKGRVTEVSVSVSDESTATRISQASATGAHVITISVRDVEEGTLTLMLSGDPLELEGNVDQVVEAIEDVETESSYRGKWYFVFDGGCIVYTFDAEGPGVDTLESDVWQALGFYDADELRQLARDAGYRLP